MQHPDGDTQRFILFMDISFIHKFNLGIPGMVFELLQIALVVLYFIYTYRKY